MLSLRTCRTNSPCIFLQSLRLLRLSTEVEGRAATLRQEALQCLTIALAGTNAVGLRDLITTFFASPQDLDNVWEYIDPKSKVARPLDLGDTETEDEEDEGSKPSTSKASSSKAATAKVKKTKGPKVKKVHRPDVVDDISQTIRCYPAGEKTVGRTGIPDHLKAKRLSKTSAASGGSLYMCPHPKCDPAYIAHGGPNPLYNHIRRHHLGISLACLYCPAKLYYAADGWRTHMKDFHPDAVWYKTEVLPSTQLTAEEEEREAAQLLAQVHEDPSILSSQARRQEATLLESFEPDTRVVVSREELEAQAHDEDVVEVSVDEEPPLKKPKVE